jgi:hypothetical protein
MKALQEDITQENQLHRRFYELAFGGLRYTEMLKNMPKHAMYANDFENYPEEMRCH